MTDEEMVRAFIAKNGITKCPPGKAEGATTRGNICAAPYGASAVGRAVGQARARREKIKGFEKKKRLRKNDKKRRFKREPITAKQVGYIHYLGGKIPNNCSKAKAWGLVRNLLRLKREAAKKERSLTPKKKKDQAPTGTALYSFGSPHKNFTLDRYKEHRYQEEHG
jgi:hypothetical protein